MTRPRLDIPPRAYKRFGPVPIPSSRFAFDPIDSSSPIRTFYERWYLQGGQSAREHCGIMRRARDCRDLRSDEQKRAFEMLDWELRQCSAWLRLQALGTPKKVKVIQFHSAR